MKVKGFNGTTSSTRVGTVLWTILDDSGHRRTLKIRNTYYVPACPLRLLSPQHYSQQTKDLRGTYSTNFGDHVLFVWNRGHHTATMPLSPTTNVGILRSAPGHQVFSSFVTLGDAAPAPLNHFCCTIVIDDEADELESDEEDDATLSSATSIEGEDDDVSDSNPTSTMPNATDDDIRPVVIPFDLDHDDPSTNFVSQDDATSALDNQSELLRWHYRLGHLPFTNLRLMAARGEKFLNDSQVARFLNANPAYTARPPRNRGGPKVKSTRSEPLLDQGNASQLIN
jgi:hypothetical protein